MKRHVLDHSHNDIDMPIDMQLSLRPTLFVQLCTV